MAVKTLKPKIAMLKSTRTASATERTRGRAWQAIRERILRRACGLCECDACRTAGRLTLATEVDHIVELADGGTDDDANLMAMSHECHARKTADSRRTRGQAG